MPENLSLAERYREAWIRLAGDGWWNESAFENRGIELLSHPAGRRISNVLDEFGEKFIQKYPGTRGVALSLRYRDGVILANQPCLTFFVSESAIRETIPPQIEGVPTDVVEAGTLVLHHVPGSIVSPLEPGCSVAHFRVTTGTLGCLVEDGTRTYILSCAHVLSDATGTAGDAVIHPGFHHGGSVPTGHIANFTRAIPLSPGVCVANAAIAEVLYPSTVASSIRYIGAKPSRTLSLGRVGVGVKKSGDQTGLTKGIVTALNATVGPYSVNGVNGIYFNNVIVATGISEGGDSGSILLSNGGEAVGLLFGGLQDLDATGKMVPVASWSAPIDLVLKHLGVTLK